MTKFGILLGAAVGYVLGTRDGRERYEQIQQQAQKFWKSPKVQETKEQATEVAKQKGSELQDKASQKVEEKKGDKASTATTTGARSTNPTSGNPAGPKHA